MTTTEYKTPQLSLLVQDKYILAMANKYTNISENEINFLSTVAKKHFNEPFGLIEVRERDISIDPVIHAKARQVMPNFSAYALVTNSKEAIQNYQYEGSFMKYDHHKLCNTVDEAKSWMSSVLSNTL